MFKEVNSREDLWGHCEGPSPTHSHDTKKRGDCPARCGLQQLPNFLSGLREWARQRGDHPELEPTVVPASLPATREQPARRPVLLDSRVRENDGENARHDGPSAFSISDGQRDIFLLTPQDLPVNYPVRKRIALAVNRYQHPTKTEGPDRNRHADRARA